MMLAQAPAAEMHQALVRYVENGAATALEGFLPGGAVPGTMDVSQGVLNSSARENSGVDVADNFFATSCVHDSFGNTTANIETVVQPYRYTGRIWDAVSGIYNNRNRDRDPFAGGFMQEDPFRFNGGINFYAYVKNNPINSTDPFGLKKAECSQPPYPAKCPKKTPKGNPEWKEQSGFWGSLSEVVFHHNLDCYREDVPVNSAQCCYDKDGNIQEGDIDKNNPDYNFWAHVGDVLTSTPQQ